MMSEPGGGQPCDLCETLEAETTEEVENDETGEIIEGDLCWPCADKLRDYSRGEDVDFSDELRLPREDDGLRADGSGEPGKEQYEKGDPCPGCGGETTVVEGTWYSCAECEWVKRYRGIGA